jgi:hypothetical protein
MQPIGASDLLDIWERGASQPPFRRAAALVAAACPELSRDQIDALPLGDRSRLLWQIRARTFGAGVTAVVACPQCAVSLDVVFDTADVLASIRVDDSAAVEHDDYVVRYRPPTSSDLALVADERMPDAALLRRCIVEARRASTAVAIEALPAAIVDLVGDRLADTGAGDRIDIALTCAACAHAWAASFDVVSFFWDEIDAWAAQMLREVHVLASAYGWREAEVLALGPARRQRYLALIAEQAG